MEEQRPYTLDRVVRLIVVLAILAAVIWVVSYAADVLIPLAAGLILAYLLDPVVRVVQRLIKNRVASVLITVSGCVLILLLIGALVVPLVSHEIRSSAALARELVEDGSPFRARLTAAVPPELSNELTNVLRDKRVQAFVENNPDLRAAAIAMAKRVLPGLWGLVSGSLAMLGLLLQLFLVLVYLIFILIDFRTFQESWQDYLPPKYRDGVVGFLGDFNDALSRYFRGQFVVALSVGILFALGFSIVGLKLAILLGLVIGLLNMVPYLQLAAVVPAFVLALLSALEGERGILWYTFGVTLVFAVVQVIQDVVITPRVMGKVTGLRPVIILFSIFFWGKLLGFLGILLAIPMTCVGLAYYRRMIVSRPASEPVTAKTPVAPA
ncbi:MAG: AI-2E family transporter [Myxococcota bacterium]